MSIMSNLPPQFEVTKNSIINDFAKDTDGIIVGTRHLDEAVERLEEMERSLNQSQSGEDDSAAGTVLFGAAGMQNPSASPPSSSS